MEYIRSKADRVYDQVCRDKILSRPGMDSYTELKEGLVPQKFMRLVRKSGHHSSLDEWADRFDCTTSELIEYLSEATLKKNRAQAVRDLEAQQKAYYQEVQPVAEEIEIPVKVRQKTILGKVSTTELLKELSRRQINGGLSEARTRQADDSFEDPRDLTED